MRNLIVLIPDHYLSFYLKDGIRRLIVFGCKDIPPCFSTISAKGDNFPDFLFASLDYIDHLKLGHLFKKNSSQMRYYFP